jgi:MFS family permease
MKLPERKVGDDVTSRHLTDLKIPHLATLIVAGMFVLTLAQPGMIGRLPLQRLLKADLHVPAADMAGFFLVIGLATYFQPFAGILIDAFPLFRTKRRSYLLISTVLAAACWVALGVLPRTYANLLYACILINLFMVVASTVIGAYLVEAGQLRGATGRLTSLRQATISVATIVNGPASGRLAEAAFTVPTLSSAALLLSFVPIAWVFMRERPAVSPPGDPLAPAKQQLGIVFRSRTLWLAIVFVAFYYFAPGFTTLLYYRQTDVLHMSQGSIGDLSVYSGVAGIVATGIYALLIRKVPIRTMLIVAMIVAALATLPYLYYDSPVLARIIETQNGFFGSFAEVALLDLAARATPAGCEGLGYSLILSMRSFALFGGDKLGAQLQASYHLPFSVMVWLNDSTTVIVLILIPFLPRLLMLSKDSEPDKLPRAS